jgi:DNA polymerase I-like protein with 3'-5' exonuclease and polymerase domains
MAKCKQELKDNGYLCSMLGRKFVIDKERTELSAFNATIQGSVAHAMQLSIRKIWELFPASVLSEHHDSLVVTCKNDNNVIRDRIRAIIGIMSRPFGSISKEYIFPVKVSVGSEYRKWTELKRYK